MMFLGNVIVTLDSVRPHSNVLVGSRRWVVTCKFTCFKLNGEKTPYDFISKLRAYNAKEISSKIQQDVLLMAGAEDHFVSLDQFYKQQQVLTSARSITTRIFTKEEKAQSHYQFGNIGLAIETILRWIEERSNRLN